MSISTQIDVMNAAANTTGLTGSLFGSSSNNIAAAQMRNTASQANYRDEGMVGMFKVRRAEDGFIIHCAPDEGYKSKVYVATTIEEALDKAKAFLVAEELGK